MTEPTYAGTAPSRVRLPVMKHRWEDLTFLHWPFPADAVQALLPDGLTVHTYDSKAWVGMVPFRIVIRLPGMPVIPWIARFPETNIRTYVKDSTGRDGVWFCSLDAQRLLPVLAARIGYRLPYVWSHMSIEHTGDAVNYVSNRKWPAPRSQSSVAVRVGEAIPPEEVTSFEHFLTARWGLFSSHRRGLHFVQAYHEPWPLFRAEVQTLDESLFAAVGLPKPEGDPVVHYSPLVKVDFGFPEKVQPR